MPLWNISHPPGAYSPEDKQAIAKAVTGVYGRVMPKFYVGVVFHEVPTHSFYVGGEPADRFVRISVDHIARTFQSEERRLGFFKLINKILGPWIADRGFDWEMHVDETPFDLWTIQGHFPPREGTDDEKRWMGENRASARTHA